MNSFRFLHAADIHLDSPLHGLARYDGVPADEVRGATRAAFDNLVQFAVEEKVDFVVIAGDLFDGDWKDMGTGLYFAKAMGLLDRNGIPAFVLAGNHDAASVITRTVPWPGNVRLFGSRRPETHLLEELGVAVHGQSFASAAVTDNLVLAYPAAREGMFNLGVLHTALAGREGHATYAPCDVNDLKAKRYDYWALGHVHGFEVVDQDPYVVFPGNLQGRNVRESGPKGAALVEVVDREVVAVERVNLDVIRWTRLEIDCSDADPDRVRSLVREALVDAHLRDADGRPLIARLVLAGESEHAASLKAGELALRDDCRALALAVSPELWLEKVQVRVRERRSAATSELPGDLTAIIAEAGADPELVEALKNDLAPFLTATLTSLGDANGDDLLRHAAQAGEWSKIVSEAASSLYPHMALES